jgi:hypothetical protein
MEEEEGGRVLEGCGVEVEEGAVRFRQPSSRSLLRWRAR